MIMEDNSSWSIKFVPFQSAVSSPFWVTYCQEKLEHIKLNEAPLPFTASYYDVVGGDYAATAARLQVDETALRSTTTDRSSVTINGSVIGYNTLEAFQKIDKNQLLLDAFVESFLHTTACVHQTVLLLTFADLKAHTVVYWFAFPALLTRPGCSIRAVQQQLVRDLLNDEACWKQYADAMMHMRADAPMPPYFVLSRSKCASLSVECFQSMGNVETLVFGFVDPSGSVGASLQNAQPMGWPMRNLIAFLSIHLTLGGHTVSILSYRPSSLRTTVDTTSDYWGDSVLLKVIVPKPTDFQWETIATEEPSPPASPVYKVVGWELNARNKPGPRSVNLRPLLDAQHLAIQAADLNLRLMKWRMIPNLDVDKLQHTKVLVLGAGTLGCCVARVLLGWGVRRITFCDYGKVSYSNPVRQPLFTLNDCAADGGSGRCKAMAAAAALRDIAADVQSEGIQISIPMPGHVEQRDTLEMSVATLDKLVQEHDVVYLLTDTRESRWLPTVMAAAHNKLLINAALGLDTWLVIRHGNGRQLGCYFCNDVVAPENSTKNRTLDQQCTVTRPGLAPIASAMAVEVMVALLHHPQHIDAPAPRPGGRNGAFQPTVQEQDDAGSSPLGILPHQIRGSLVSYTMMTPTVPAFAHCTGCAPAIVDAYQADPVGFVHDVCASTDGHFLEDVSGLTAFRSDAAEKLDDMMTAIDDDDAWEE